MPGRVSARINARTRPQFQAFDPKLIALGAAGATVDPVLPTFNGTYQWGRWIERENGDITVQQQLQFLSSFTVGTAEAYGFLLPRPAFRHPVGPTPLRGRVLCYMSFGSRGATSTPDVNALGQLELVGLGDWGSIDDYDPDTVFVARIEELLDWGQANISAGSSSVTVSHRLGVTFDPSDVTVRSQGSTFPTAADAPYIDPASITTSQFTIALRAASAAGVALQWKIRCSPPAGVAGSLVGPTVPWDMSRATALTPFANFFLSATYEQRHAA